MTETASYGGLTYEVGTAGGAVFSECRRYRYLLRRGLILAAALRPAIFCMLNPSKAGADDDDPSSRRVNGFARAWGCDSAVIVNAYGLVVTDPDELWKCNDPVGSFNDAILRQTARHAKRAQYGIVCAWGMNAKSERVDRVVELFHSVGARLTCLAQCADGTPKHPLYLRGDLMPREYRHDQTAKAPAGPSVTEDHE